MAIVGYTDVIAARKRDLQNAEKSITSEGWKNRRETGKKANYHSPFRDRSKGNLNKT